MNRAVAPWGRTAEFAKSVAEKFGVGFADAWLGPHCCRFTDTTVFTTGLGAERLRLACEAELAAATVTVRACPDVIAAFRRGAL